MKKANIQQHFNPEVRQTFNHELGAAKYGKEVQICHINLMIQPNPEITILQKEVFSPRKGITDQAKINYCRPLSRELQTLVYIFQNGDSQKTELCQKF